MACSNFVDAKSLAAVMSGFARPVRKLSRSIALSSPIWSEEPSLAGDNGEFFRSMQCRRRNGHAGTGPDATGFDSGK
jgi:hypothetical protein